MDYLDIRYFDVTAIMGSLPLHKVTDKGDSLMFCCPFHNDDTPSYTFNKVKGLGHCFGCGKGHNLYTFVKELTGKSIYKEYLNVSLQDYFFQKTLEKRGEAEKSADITLPELNIIADKIPPYSHRLCKNFCKSRKISEKDILFHNMFYIEKGFIGLTKYEKRLVIPMKDEKGNIIAYEGRDVTREQAIKCIYPKNSLVRQSIFSIDKLHPDKPTILVEGIMDVFNTQNALPKYQVTSPFGITVSPSQAKLINTLTDITVLYDPDEGGERGINIISEIYKGSFKVALLPEFDPDESSIETIRKAVHEAVDISKYYMKKFDILQPRNFSWFDKVS